MGSHFGPQKNNRQVLGFVEKNLYQMAA